MNCARLSFEAIGIEFIEKFDGNVARDKRNTAALRRLGWSVLTVWECQLKKAPEKVAERLQRLLSQRED